MLPNMEQGALYNSINFYFGTGQGDAGDSVIQSTVTRTRINSMICPSASLPAGNLMDCRELRFQPRAIVISVPSGAGFEYDGSQTGGARRSACLPGITVVRGNRRPRRARRDVEHDRVR